MPSGVLHTLSSYAKTIPTPFYVPREGYNISIDETAAREKERNLYLLFNQTTFAGFKSEIKKLLSSNDLKIIKEDFSFQAISNFIDSLPKRFTIKNLRQGQYFELTMNTSLLEEEGEKIANILKESLSGKNRTVSFKDGIFYISAIFNRTSLIDIINKTQNKRFGKEGKKFSNNFINFIKELEANPESYIEITQNRNGQKEKFSFLAENMSPYQYSTNDLKILAKKNPKDFLNIFEQIKNQITKDFEAKVSSGSDELKIATKNLLNQVLPKIRISIEEQAFITEGDFFLTGQNTSAIKGFFGEFQNALLFEFLKIKYNKPLLVQILGNKIEDSGFKPREDIFIRDFAQDMGFRIQSKMSSNYSLDQGVNVYVTVAEVNNTGLMTYSFADFMANAIFNKNSEFNYKEVTEETYKALREYAALRANLSKNFGLASSIDFYWIQGQFLIPASVIMESLNLENGADFKTFKKGGDIQLDISGISRHDDDYFRQKEKNEINGRSDYFNWMRYWEKGSGGRFKKGDFIPTQENENEFEKIINKAHFKSSLRLARGINFNDYSLF